MASALPLPGQFEGTPGVYRQSVQADLYDNDRATRQTVEAMAQHIRYCASDPYIRWAASDALRTWGHISARAGGVDQSTVAWACWWWVKSNVRFAQDDEQLLRLLNERDQLELLITPSVMVRLESRAGDCDDFTMLLCCLLEVCGVPWRIQTVACDPSDPSRWSHVYAGCVLPDGQLVALDASHGKFPGWHIPTERTYRLQVWNQDGTPDGEEQHSMNGIRGLHGYTMAPIQAAANARALRPAAPAVRVFNLPSLPAQANARAGSALAARVRRRGRIGVGDDSVDSVSLSDMFGGNIDPALLNQGSATYYSGSAPATTSGSSANNTALINFLGGETSALTKIFGQSVAPQTTIQTPQGLLITGPSGAIANTSLPTIAAGGLNMTSLLMVGGIGLLAIVAIKAMGK